MFHFYLTCYIMKNFITGLLVILGCTLAAQPAQVPAPDSAGGYARGEVWLGLSTLIGSSFQPEVQYLLRDNLALVGNMGYGISRNEYRPQGHQNFSHALEIFGGIRKYHAPFLSSRLQLFQQVGISGAIRDIESKNPIAPAQSFSLEAAANYQLGLAYRPISRLQFTLIFASARLRFESSSSSQPSSDQSFRRVSGQVQALTGGLTLTANWRIRS